MTTDKRCISAPPLQRQLRLGIYENSMDDAPQVSAVDGESNREPLRGEVEIDDTWIGGPQAGIRGSRQFKGKKAALVLAAVEKRGRATGRVSMKVIPDFKAATRSAFMKKHVAQFSACARLLKILKAGPICHDGEQDIDRDGDRDLGLHGIFAGIKPQPSLSMSAHSAPHCRRRRC
jgi:hypothetical protein